MLDRGGYVGQSRNKPPSKEPLQTVNSICFWVKWGWAESQSLLNFSSVFASSLCPRLILYNCPTSESQVKKINILVKHWKKLFMKFVVVHPLNHVWLFAIPWTVASQAPLSSAVSQSLPKFMSTELMMLSNPSLPLMLSYPFAFNLSQH